VARKASRGFRVAEGYRRLLVPLDDGPESSHALAIACRVAADNRARITAVAVIEVPPLLPLDAHLREEEHAARELLDHAGATAESHGVKLSPKVVRARDSAAAIVEQARADHVELVIIGVQRAPLASSSGHVNGDTVLHVLKGAPCRVMVVSNPFREAA
jgi:nucleotide-binding universal stress UspA family protein